MVNKIRDPESMYLSTERPARQSPTEHTEVIADYNTPPDTPMCEGEVQVQNVIQQLADNIMDTQDLLTAAKISQVCHANKECAANPSFIVGSQILLATVNHRREYMQMKDGHVAKFMPRFDGPFEVIKAFPDSSTYMLRLPEHTKIHRTFHASLLHSFVNNDTSLFPSRALEKPGPVVTVDGEIEYFIEKILDECTRGRGKQFLVRWLGYSTDADLWLPRRELADTEAYTDWIKYHNR
jgi:hypothetical protein